MPLTKGTIRRVRVVDDIHRGKLIIDGEQDILENGKVIATIPIKVVAKGDDYQTRRDELYPDAAKAAYEGKVDTLLGTHGKAETRGGPKK